MTFSLLGIDTKTGKRVEISQSARRQGTYIIGGTGQGKTGLIENLIVQDIRQGLGVAVLDPHGDLTNSIIARIPEERVQDVILLDIADEEHPFGLNLFTCENPKSSVAVQYVVDQVMHIFEKLFEVSRGETPLLLDYLRNCAYALIANPGFTMADIPLLFTNKACRQKLLTNVKDSDVKLFWQQYDEMKPNEQREESASTLRRVREFLQPLARNVVGQAQSTIDLRKVMDERKILLITLDARLPSVTSLIGSVFIALLLNAAYSRGDLEQKRRKQFNIYADEFQRFATEDMAILLTEARKFGIATTIGHQTLSQISEKNKAAALQAGNLVVFRVTGTDSQELASSFDCTPPPADVRREEILTPVSDVLGHLKNRGWHRNPFVNDFVHKYNLLETPEYGFLFSRANRGVPFDRLIQTEEEKTLFFMMAKQQLYTVIKEKLTIPSSRFRRKSMNKKEEEEWYILAQFYLSVFQCFYFERTNSWHQKGWDDYNKDYGQFCHKYEDSIDPTKDLVYALFLSADNPQGGAFQQAAKKLEQFVRSLFLRERGYHYDVITEEINGAIRMYDYASRSLTVEEAQRSLQHLNTLAARFPIVTKHHYLDDYWVSSQKCQTLAEREADELIRQQKPLVEQFFIDLCKVLRILADDPIVSGSGNYQSIPGAQRTYQDMQNEIASRLANLPKYTAFVKVSPDERTIESTIKTVEPEFGIGRKKLEARKQQIKEQNLHAGYLRKHEEVEEEILTRQSNCRGTIPSSERFKPERDV